MIRPSEWLLRRVVGDASAYNGLVGDLREETARAGRGGLAYDRAVLGMCISYLTDRFRPGGGTLPGGRDHEPGWRSVVNDVVAASRRLRRRPAFTVSVVGTLALCFGAAGAVLSVAYGVWWKPLPFGNPAEIVRVYEVKLDADSGSIAGDGVASRSRMSPPLLADLRAARWDTVEEFASVSGLAVDWRVEGESRRLSGVTASRGVFEVLQLRPVVGRWFSPEPGTNEVVLSAQFWVDAFGGDPAVVGQGTMELDGEPFLIVGVASDGLPYPQAAGQVWLPSDPDPQQLSEGMRGARYLDVVARLRPDVTITSAAGELDAFVRNLGDDHPNHRGWGATAIPLRSDLIRPFLGIMRLLVTAAALFLLIACANTAALLTARRERERTELAIRRALGASRWRLVRGELAELTWLAGSGAVSAAVLAYWVLTPLRQLAPSDVPRIAGIQLAPLVVLALTATLFVAAWASALLGVLRPDSAIAGRSRSVAGRASGLTALTVVQVALTTILLIGGAALADHFRGLAGADPGFDAEGVMTAPVVLGAESYDEAPRRLQFFDALIERLERGGHAVAVATNPPVAGINMRFGYRAGDWEEEQFWGQYHTVSERYFEVMGIPLVAGRLFGSDDHVEAAPAVIISERLAEEHFDTDPIGQEMIVVGTSREIVGVVGSVRHFGPDQEAPPEMYVPMAQDTWLLGHVVVRPGAGFAATDVRNAVAAIDTEVPVDALFPYDTFVRTWFAPLRFQLVIVSLLAATGTLLAIVGLYALIAYVVAGRTREIGIRVALGESTRSVFSSVVRRGLVLAVMGLATGGLAAFWLRGLMGAAGVDATPESPRVLLAVAMLVLVATTAACSWPARRAARVDPATALRAD